MKPESIVGFDLTFPAESLKAALVVSLLSVWVLIGLFHYLNRYTRRQYFTVWTGAWLFYAVWLILRISFLQEEPPPLLMMLQHWCLSGTVVLLLWGSAGFLEPLNRPVLFGLFTAFLLVWTYVGAYHLENRLQAELPVFGLIGLASLVTAYCFFRFRATSGYLGAGLLGFGFGLWGLQLCATPFVQHSSVLASASYFSGAVLQLFIAVSMIVLVLEEVRSDQQRVQQRMDSMRVEKIVLESEVTLTGERYQQLFQQANEGIILVQARNLRILEMNQAAERLLGISRTDAADTCMADYIVGAGDGSESSDTDWLDWLARQDQVAVKRADGSQVPVNLKGSTITWACQPAFQLCLYDLTEQMELQRRFRQTAKLTALGGLIAGDTLAPQARTLFANSASEDNHAARPDTRLPDRTRGQELHLEPTYLNQILVRVADLCRYNPLANGVEVELTVDKTLSLVNLEADLVELALNDLVSNALQAMSGRESARRLRLATCRMGGMVQITVEDSGPGEALHSATEHLDPSHAAIKALQATSPESSIVRGIIAAHGGQAACRPSELGGVAVVILLPLEEVAAASAPPAPIAIQAARPTDIRAPNSEDDPADMLGHDIRLRSRRPAVRISPQEAATAVRRHGFELVR